MAFVVVQVGQAGNQVGGALWEAIRAELSQQKGPGPGPGRGQGHGRPPPQASTSLLRWDSSTHQLRARAVFVDMEPKAVQAVCRGPAGGLVDPQRCVLGHSGCANNWAHGYRMSQKSVKKSLSIGGGDEVSVLDECMQCIHAELQGCAIGPPEIIMIYSLAGGSGSGLGSRILERIRELYPLYYVLVVAVVPALAGDTTVQSLNACMALQWLQAYADGVILFRNDAIIAGLERRKGAAGSAAAAGSPSLSDVNQYIATVLAGLLLPAPGLATELRRHRTLRRLVTHVCPNPEMKFLEAHHASVTPTSSRGKPSWVDVARQLGTLMDRFDTLADNKPVMSTATVAVAWGPGGKGGAAEEDEILQAINKSSGLAHVAWREAKDSVRVLPVKSCPRVLVRQASAVRKGKGVASGSGAAVAEQDAKALTIVSNRSLVIGLFSHLAERAMVLCEANAYMHWYERHGCPRAALEDAAKHVQAIADCYSHWHRQP